MKRTQYDRILEHLLKVGNAGASYLSLSVVARANCPWRRLSELENKGFRFKRWLVEYDGRKHTIVALAGSSK
jgi:hypothetical protein